MIVKVRRYFQVTKEYRLKETTNLINEWLSRGAQGNKQEVIAKIGELYSLIDKLVISQFFKVITITNDKLFILELDLIKDGTLYIPKKLYFENNEIFVEIEEVN